MREIVGRVGGQDEDLHGVSGWNEAAVLDVIDKKDRVARFATEEGVGDDTAAAVLAIPVTALAAYGIYRVAKGGGSKSSGGAWLHKLNPSYWFKSSAEKRFVDIEKSRGKRNVELEKELAAAERAYHTSQAASAKEQQIQSIEQSLKSHGVSGEAFVGAARKKGRRKVNAQAAQEQFVAQAAAAKAPLIAQIAQSKGLAGKRVWTRADADQVAIGLLQTMMKDTKQAPGAGDAGIARKIVRFWAGKSGVTMQGDEIGSVDKTVGKIVTAPFRATWWGAKKIGQGTVATAKWVGRGFKGKKKSSADRRKAALLAAHKRRAAAQKKILAAEKKHLAAVEEREEEKRIAEIEAKAAEAEAAAAEAEAVALEAEVMKDVPGEAEALEGWTVVGGIPPAFVGKAALAAATPTPVGAMIRRGAAAARAARKSPEARKVLKEIQGKAAKGDRKAVAQLRTIKAGAIADAQRTQALRKDAIVKRGLAERLKTRLKKIKLISYGHAAKPIKVKPVKMPPAIKFTPSV